MDAMAVAQWCADEIGDILRGPISGRIVRAGHRVERVLDRDGMMTSVVMHLDPASLPKGDGEGYEAKAEIRLGDGVSVSVGRVLPDGTVAAAARLDLDLGEEELADLALGAMTAEGILGGDWLYRNNVRLEQARGRLSEEALEVWGDVLRDAWNATIRLWAEGGDHHGAMPGMVERGIDGRLDEAIRRDTPLGSALYGRIKAELDRTVMASAIGMARSWTGCWTG